MRDEKPLLEIARAFIVQWRERKSGRKVRSLCASWCYIYPNIIRCTFVDLAMLTMNDRSKIINP